MKNKGIICSPNNLVVRLLHAACGKLLIDTIAAAGEDDFFRVLKEKNLAVVFMDENFADGNPARLIGKIRTFALSGDVFIVLIVGKEKKASPAGGYGADAVLPVPFPHGKFESLLRFLDGKPKRILIAASPKSRIRLVSRSLKEGGVEVSFASNSDECIHTAHTVFPDLVFIENSSVFRGITLCRQLKNIPLLSEIPVLIYSENTDPVVIEKCFDSGAKDVLLGDPLAAENISKINSLVAPPKRGRKERALVIDDSPMIRNIISKMFKKLGFSVATAEDGKEGLRVASETKPDIITCDYDMPVMNGWEFCVKAKETTEIKEVPIIMVTARGTEVDKKKGAVLGVFDYLTKPFKEEELGKCVRRALTGVRAKKEREALSKYVARDVISNVGDVIDGIKNREPELKFITLIFTDICSFTPKCEKLRPKEMVELLNSYFTLMIAQLQRNNAIVDKLIGDAIVARFDSGDPRTDAYNAVKGAEEMLEALKEFNSLSSEPIEIRIGINSGEVVLGNIGSESYRLDYTMIGDNVNIGARLESASPNMGCLISEATYKLVSERVSVGPGLDLMLKGKSRKIRAFPLSKVLS